MNAIRPDVSPEPSPESVSQAAPESAVQAVPIAAPLRGASVEPWPRWAWALAWAVVLGGAARMVRRFAEGYSLFFDEANLAAAILDRPWGQLHLALDNQQIAPLGLIYVGRALLDAFGLSEMALRALPLSAGLGSLALLPFWLRRFVSPWPALATLVLAAVCADAVVYASQFKQYTLELLFALWVMFAVDAWLRRPGWRPLAVAACGAALGVWFAMTTVFVAGGLGVVLAARVAVRDRSQWKSVALAGAVVGGAFVLAYLLHVRHVRRADELMGFMDGYWQAGYVANPVVSPGKFIQAWVGVFRKPASLALPGLGLGLAVLGAWTLLVRDRWRGVALLTPLAVAAALSLAGVYPLQDRLALYLLAAIWPAMALGLERLQRARPGGFVAAALLAALLVIPAVQNRGRMTVEDLMPVVDRVNAAAQPGDTFYLYYGGRPMHDLYARVDPERGLPADGLVHGVRAREDWPAYLADLDALAGRERVWVVFGHVVTWRGIDERRLMLMHLDRLGERRQAFEGAGAWAYLYDLTGPSADGSPDAGPAAAGAAPPTEP
ncbi:MAG: hypothetical protein AAF288_03445 [Planctomycetota bacterium]